jgi:DNA-binding NarL/FixJ family response regulator
VALRGGGGMTIMDKENSKPVRVLVVDNHPIVRRGICSELEKTPGVEVVGEANDGREALQMVETLKPAVVFMDISMPGLNGLEATSRIARDFPDVRVVILSKHEEEEYYWHALKIGAAGYLLKRAAIAELQAAIERVIGGELYLSKDLSMKLVKKLPLQRLANQRNPLDQLTDRQREVLQLIAEGQNTKSIADILKVSPKTVEYHRAKLMQILQIYDIPGLVRFALRTRLITQEG